MEWGLMALVVPSPTQDFPWIRGSCPPLSLGSVLPTSTQDRGESESLVARWEGRGRAGKIHPLSSLGDSPSWGHFFHSLVPCTVLWTS